MPVLPNTLSGIVVGVMAEVSLWFRANALHPTIVPAATALVTRNLRRVVLRFMLTYSAKNALLFTIAQKAFLRYLSLVIWVRNLRGFNRKCPQIHADVGDILGFGILGYKRMRLFV